jgi:hypothetical protein
MEIAHVEIPTSKFLFRHIVPEIMRRLWEEYVEGFHLGPCEQVCNNVGM